MGELAGCAGAHGEKGVPETCRYRAHQGRENRPYKRLQIMGERGPSEGSRNGGHLP